MNRAPRLSKAQQEILSEKRALEQLLSSENGDLLLDYLAKLCLNDMGLAKKDGLEYAYSEGRRSVYLTLMQFAKRPFNKMLNEMIEKQEVLND